MQLAITADQCNASNWFTHCATSQKVQAPTINGVIGIFYLLNHSDWAPNRKEFLEYFLRGGRG